MKINSKTPRTVSQWQALSNNEGIAVCGDITAHVYETFCDLQYEGIIFMTLYTDGKFKEYNVDLTKQYIDLLFFASKNISRNVP